MNNYISADIHRILQKQSFFGTIGAFIGLFLVMVFILIHILHHKCMLIKSLVL